MAISDKIKQHRKRIGITQRELAETLGVSVQAISKWETGSGIPDVTALIPLAKELHITTDELLDFHDRRKELEKQWQGVLRQYGDSSKELYDCACEALKEYPDDETFLYRRACNARFLYESMDASATEKERWFQIHEAQLFGLINQHPEWEWPVSEMVYLLVAAGKKKEAMPYANRTNGETRSRLLKQCLEGDDLRHHRQSLVSKKLNELLCELRCDDPVFLDTIEQLIKALIPDGNYLYFHGHLMTVEIKRAEIAVLKKEYDRALSHLQQAFVYVRREDASPSGNFTCPIFSTIYFKCNRESGHPSLYEQFLHIVTSNKSLAPLRNRNAYKRLIHQAEACMEYSSSGLYEANDTDETAFPLSEFIDLIDMAKADIEESDKQSTTSALIIMMADGSIYRFLLTDPRPVVTDEVLKIVEDMKKTGNTEISRVVCLRNGFFVIPCFAVLRLFCAMHRNNQDACMLLSGNNGLLKRKLKDNFPSHLKPFLYCMPDASELFEPEEYDGYSCGELISIGKKTLTELRSKETLSDGGEVVVLRTARGNTYCHYESDFSSAAHDSIFAELSEKQDTQVEVMLCMTANGGFDLGNFRFRDRLFDLDERNGGTKILLQGFDNLHFRTLFSCFSSHKLADISRQNELNIRIKRLERERIEEYLSFFDRVSSNSLLCYCTNFHRTGEEVDTFFRSAFDGEKAMMEFARNEGKQFASEARIQGYLVYCDNEVIGWCQAKDKTSYRYLGTGVPIDADKAGEVIGISCLVIDENHRGRGIGSALLEYVANEERNRGYKYLEAYPNRGCLWNDALFDDMIRLYEKQGFVTVVKREDWRQMRKDLRSISEN